MMLTKFSVKNFKNFKERITLDFKDVSDYQFNEDVIKNGVLSKIGIFGKNSTGKTNFGYALFDITLHLIDKLQRSEQIEEKSYKNAMSIEDVATFSYHFNFDGLSVEYNYTKSAPTKLVSEELFVDGTKVLAYNFKNQKGEYPRLDLIGAPSLIFPSNGLNISVIRYIAFNANIAKDSIIDKLMHFVDHMLWFRSVEDGFGFIGFRNKPDFIVPYIIDHGYEKKLENFLKNCGIEVKLVVKPDVIGIKNLVVDYGNDQFLPFWTTASSGTKALTLFFFWSSNFDATSFVFIDEFDAFYHFELAEEIVRKMIENKNCQMIFTSHNTGLMSNSLLRPNCYFVLANNQLKSFKNLTERVIREANNLEKLYKQGEFDF